MRTAVLYGKEDIRTEDRPVPEPGPGQMLVKIDYVGICGTDIEFYKLGQTPTPLPKILGHENSGTIVKLGEGVTESGGAAVGTFLSASIASCFCLASILVFLIPASRIAAAPNIIKSEIRIFSSILSLCFFLICVTSIFRQFLTRSLCLCYSFPLQQYVQSLHGSISMDAVRTSRR